MWFWVKLLIPLFGWVAACLWVGRRHLLAAQLAASGGVLAGRRLYFA